uniref:Uncharacterized protein n=1 Tax=Rhizophora mucronata TaxID=61149 RepID=A0A2P2MDP1_RHIMU
MSDPTFLMDFHVRRELSSLHSVENLLKIARYDD